MKGFGRFLALVTLTSMAGRGWAAPPVAPPDAGTLLDTVKSFFFEKPEEKKPTEELIHAPVDLPPAMIENDQLRVKITSIELSGNRSVPTETLLELVKDEIGKEIGFNDMVRITGILTKYYRDHGYFVTRVYIPEQKLEGGVLKLIVLEGGLGGVQVHIKTAGPTIPDSLVKELVLDNTPIGAPLTVQDLERSMLLINELPKTSATSALVPGKSVGTSDLVVEVEQSGRFANTTVTADNYGNIYSGAARAGANTVIASPLALGDQLTLRGISSGKGFDYGRASWAMPYGGTGLKYGLDLTLNDYRLGGPFNAAGMRGESSIFGALEVFPIVRSRFVDLYQSATIEYKVMRNVANSGPISDKRVTVVNLGLNGDASDKWLGLEGLNTFALTLTVGNSDLGRDSTDWSNDAQTMKSAGGYEKISLQASRQQQIVDGLILVGSLNAQVASKNLDSSESMVFGGPTGIRAYPAGEAPADEGVMANLEFRYNTQAPLDMGALQYQLFCDYGRVRLHRFTWASFNTSGIPDDYSLASSGIGFNLYKKDIYMVSAALATKIGNNPNPGAGGVDADGLKSRVRGWMQLTLFF
jgi:hemolysin activation/secretion protein